MKSADNDRTCNSRVKSSGVLWASKALPNKIPKCIIARPTPSVCIGMVCPIKAIGAGISSSFRGRPNRKWPTHARCSLRRRWCCVGAGSIPGIGQAFGPGAGGRGLTGLQAVKRAAAPTGIIHALDAKRILRYASLGRNRNVIDHPDSCCSEQCGEGYSGHFRTFMAGEAPYAEPLASIERGRASEGTLMSRTLFTPLIASWGRDYSLLNRSLCKFGILSKDLQQSQRGIISNQASRLGSCSIRCQLETAHVRFTAVAS
jgi:hypothetical protein